MPYFTNQEFLEMLLIYGECGRNARQAAIIYSQRFPNVRKPNAMTFLRLIDRVGRTGSVQRKPKTDRNPPTINEDMEIDILAMFHVDPHTSTREVADICNVSHSSVVKVLKKHKYHDYKCSLLQALYEGDEGCRLNFADAMLQKCDDNDNFLANVFWSDESLFTRQGVFNRRNYHYWASANPHWYRPHHHQIRWTVNVWCGICGDTVIGPVFIDGALDQHKYRQLLEEHVVDGFIDNLPLAQAGNVWYQHDGAGPHFAVSVRQYLDEIFGDRWIGRGGPLAWPPRSPDMNPLDFFLWGFIKEKVYETPPLGVEDCKARITAVCNELRNNPHIFARIRHSLYQRLQTCVAAEGAHFEHVL